MFISVTVKLKLDFSFTNKLEKCYLYKIVTPTDIDVSNRFSDNCKHLFTW